MTSDTGRTVELRLRAAVESSPSGLLMVDADGHIVLVNREIERLFEYSREELLGKSIEVLLPERFRDAHGRFRNEFFTHPRVRPMGVGRDFYGRRRNGSEVPIEIGLTPIATEEGLFVLASIVDISARRRADERFRVAVESSPDGMVMTDVSGKIVLVNRAVERMFGYVREELLGSTIEILVPERFRRDHPSYRASFFDDPRSREMGQGRDLFGLRKDGKEIPVEIGLNPIETDEGLFVLSSIVDISGRKHDEEERLRLEQDLRQAQKMEAIGTLAGGVAHDFNNILGAIIGYAELVRGAVTSEQARADLAQVLASAERGRQLVQRILAFSRRQDQVRRPTALGETVSDVSRLLRSTLPPAIDIITKISPNTPRVMADPTSVHQVLMNLGTNAWHAMPSGGTLEITLEPLYVRDSVARGNPELREGPYAILRTRDTGVGMDRAVRERAFEPFFTTKPLGTGTGLGLAMVHGIMRDHQGSVEIESEVGKGTLIKCYFPAIAAEAPESLKADTSIHRGSGERILYVDDEPTLARVGERRLSALGYEVMTATDSIVALEHVKDTSKHFDVVITDYLMPRMNGLELAREIHRLRPELPIILLTGYIEDLSAESTAQAGIRRIATKPATAQDLALAVYETIAH